MLRGSLFYAWGRAMGARRPLRVFSAHEGHELRLACGTEHALLLDGMYLCFYCSVPVPMYQRHCHSTSGEVRCTDLCSHLQTEDGRLLGGGRGSEGQLGAYSGERVPLASPQEVEDDMFTLSLCFPLLPIICACSD